MWDEEFEFSDVRLDDVIKLEVSYELPNLAVHLFALVFIPLHSISSPHTCVPAQLWDANRWRHDKPIGYAEVCISLVRRQGGMSYKAGTAARGVTLHGGRLQAPRHRQHVHNTWTWKAHTSHLQGWGNEVDPSITTWVTCLVASVSSCAPRPALAHGVAGQASRACAAADWTALTLCLSLAKHSDDVCLVVRGWLQDNQAGEPRSFPVFSRRRLHRTEQRRGDVFVSYEFTVEREVVSCSHLGT